MTSEEHRATKGDEQNITTIKLTRTTKARLDHLRLYRRETYDEILQKMLEILNVCRSYPERARVRLISLDKQKKRSTKEAPHD